MLNALLQFFVGAPSLLTFIFGIIVGLVYSLTIDYLTYKGNK